MKKSMFIEKQYNKNEAALLSVVVPSLNPETLFISTISKILVERPEVQVIIVDDCSDTDVSTFFSDMNNLKVTRNTQRRGAGYSRNVGIKLATGKYTVFMDDDDAMDWGVVDEIISIMEEQPSIDVSVSSYKFLKDGLFHHAWPDYRSIIDNVLGGQTSRILNIDGNEDILRLNNFPWTKVYRTDFIKEIDLRFSETLVQNDIHAHWQSLLFAKRILVTNRIQCTQTINHNGSRINNTNDERRLEAFIALRETYDLVRRRGLAKAEVAFWKFYESVSRWMINASSPETRPLLMKEHISFSGIMPLELIHTQSQLGWKRWELWNMNYLEKLVPCDGVEVDSHNNTDQLDICLVEISRLQRLATELRGDNDRLSNEVKNRTLERDRLTSELRTRSSEVSSAHDQRLRDSKRVEELELQVDELQRHVNSRAAQISFKMRRIYRIFVPYRGSK